MDANAAITNMQDGTLNVKAYVKEGIGENRYMFATESNVINLLGVHEYKLHGIEETDDHLIVYPMGWHTM